MLFQPKREPAYPLWFSYVVSCLLQEAAQHLDDTALPLC